MKQKSKIYQVHLLDELRMLIGCILLPDRLLNCYKTKLIVSPKVYYCTFSYPYGVLQFCPITCVYRLSLYLDISRLYQSAQLLNRFRTFEGINLDVYLISGHIVLIHVH